MKIFKNLPSYFLLIVVLALPFYTQTAHKNSASNVGVVHSVMNTNESLAIIIENLEILIFQMKKGIRNVVAKKQALKAIDNAEKNFTVDIKKLLNTHIAVIKEESAHFFDKATYDSDRIDQALLAFQAEIEKLTKKGSESVVKKTTTDVEKALIKKEKITSDATAIINQIRQQLALGKITELKAAKLIVQQNKRISLAEKRLQDLSDKAVAVVRENDAQASYLNRFIGGSKALGSAALAPLQAGYFSTQEDKDIARAVIAELEQVKLELSGFYYEAIKSVDLSEEDKQLLTRAYNDNMQKIDEDIRQQKIITGDTWSTQRKLFWGTVALAGAAGLGLTASKYLSVPQQQSKIDFEEQQRELRMLKDKQENKLWSLENQLGAAKSSEQHAWKVASSNRSLANEQRLIQQQLAVDDKNLESFKALVEDEAADQRRQLRFALSEVEQKKMQRAPIEANLRREQKTAEGLLGKIVEDQKALYDNASMWGYTEDEKARIQELKVEAQRVRKSIEESSKALGDSEAASYAHYKDIKQYESDVTALNEALKENIEHAEKQYEAKNQGDVRLAIVAQRRAEGQTAALQTQIEVAKKAAEEQGLEAERKTEELKKQIDAIKQQAAVKLDEQIAEQEALQLDDDIAAIERNKARIQVIRDDILRAREEKFQKEHPFFAASDKIQGAVTEALHSEPVQNVKKIVTEKLGETAAATGELAGKTVLSPEWRTEKQKAVKGWVVKGLEDGNVSD